MRVPNINVRMNENGVIVFGKYAPLFRSDAIIKCRRGTRNVVCGRRIVLQGIGVVFKLNTEKVIACGNTIKGIVIRPVLIIGLPSRLRRRRRGNLADETAESDSGRTCGDAAVIR